MTTFNINAGRRRPRENSTPGPVTVEGVYRRQTRNMQTRRWADGYFICAVLQQRRRIGIIVPSVAISEKHMDATEITGAPRELGAPTNDHAYIAPAEVTMELGFTAADR